MTVQRKKMLFILALLILVFFAVGYFFLVHQSQKTVEAAKDPNFMKEEFEAGFEKMEQEVRGNLK